MKLRFSPWLGVLALALYAYHQHTKMREMDDLYKRAFSVVSEAAPLLNGAADRERRIAELEARGYVADGRLPKVVK